MNLTAKIGLEASSGAAFLILGLNYHNVDTKKREALPLTTRKLLDQSFLRQCEKAVWKAAVPTASGISCSCSDSKRTVSYPCFAKHPSASHMSLGITADATMPIFKSQKSFDLSHPSNGTNAFIDT